MADNLYWVWLSECCRYNTDTFDRLVRHYATPRHIFNADEQELVSVVGKRNGDVVRILEHDLSVAERIMHYCVMTDTGIIAYDDSDYPARLRMLSDPPPVLYYRGRRLSVDNDLLVSVVGTRKMSEYGKRMAFEIAHDLARAGAVVVTGMALGIDGVASAAALAAGKPTIAVLGSGLDIVYPKEHTRLFSAIAEHGTVISEFAPGTSPEGRNFPRRNRIISGLSQATVVIEGDENSGALISAKHAERQGRDVFALPGNADEKNSEATALLLKRGARPLTCADDVIGLYEPLYPGRLNMFKLLEPTKVRMNRVLSSLRVSARPYYPKYKAYDGDMPVMQEKTPAPKPQKQSIAPQKTEMQEAQSASRRPNVSAELPPEKAKLFDEKTLAVYRAIPPGHAMTVDEICAAGFSAAEVMAALTMLEIYHCVTSIAGGRYVRP